MNEETQHSGNRDQLFACPYDYSHQVEFKRMEEHLTECRERALVSEKAVCPFDEQHVVFAPEIDYHKTICPQRPRESEEPRDIKCNGKNSGVSEDVIEYESTRAKGNSPSEIEKDLATGCMRGLEVGGRGNQVSVFEQEDDTDKKVSCGDDQEMEPKKSETDKSASEENIRDGDSVIPLNHKTSVEKQLSQSDSDTTETDASATSSESDQERFDYLKYKPSKEEREEFLRLIRQQSEADAYEDKYTAMDQQAYQSALWAQTYTYVSNQYPAYLAPYLPYPNSYPVMTAIPPQHPYTAGYFTPSMLPPPGVGFIHSAHGAYECGHMNRPHHHFRRRNHYPSRYHSRYNSRFHNSDSQNHGDTDSNSSGQSDTGLSDEIMVTHSVSNGTNGKHASSKEACMKQTNGGFHQKGSATWQEKCHKKNTMDGRNGVIKHFVDIGNVEERAVNGNLSDSSQEKDAEGERAESEEKKSEQEKRMRKLKKKITEIVLLEKKRSSGATLDCDQLKKLSRKKDYEVQLQYLSQGN